MARPPPTLEGFPAQAGFPELEGFPAQEGFPALAGFSALAGFPGLEGCPALEGFPAQEGFPALLKLWPKVEDVRDRETRKSGFQKIIGNNQRCSFLRLDPQIDFQFSLLALGRNSPPCLLRSTFKCPSN